MMHSGSVVDTSDINRYKADKHSTGGIGDKVSLILAPLVACCDIAIPMISGRGLGITGGTLDKMESIKGYRTDLSIPEFLKVVDECGCSIIGQTLDLAPADKKLYALRDVTGTVPSIPLISASIMSKKLAEGMDGLVLDVKYGNGAFMKTEKDAEALAQVMVDIGSYMGKGMTAILTDMNQPLGRTAGNALEVIETIEALHGNGAPDLMEVTMTLSAHMLLLAGKASDLTEALTILQDHLDGGRAFDKFLEMTKMHGGDTEVINNPDLLPKATIKQEYPATQDGYIKELSAESVGRACLELGAGRRAVTDKIDYAVGISDIKKIGDPIKKGDPIMTLHANDQQKLKIAIQELRKGISISPEKTPSPKLINKTITP
jgi:pyrimidine-nucleoside phosphorylase